jgi:hypothetical protein
MNEFQKAAALTLLKISYNFGGCSTHLIKK